MINFRLSYLNGLNFIDLFPKTSLNAIVDEGSLLQISVLPVTIPATTENVQTINLDLTDGMEDAWVEMYLSGNTVQNQEDYSTITQYQIQNNQLIITRLNNKPVGQIQVNLVFYLNGG